MWCSLHIFFPSLADSRTARVDSIRVVNDLFITTLWLTSNNSQKRSNSKNDSFTDSLLKTCWLISFSWKSARTSRILSHHRPTNHIWSYKRLKLVSTQTLKKWGQQSRRPCLVDKKQFPLKYDLPVSRTMKTKLIFFNPGLRSLIRHTFSFVFAILKQDKWQRKTNSINCQPPQIPLWFKMTDCVRHLYKLPQWAQILTNGAHETPRVQQFTQIKKEGKEKQTCKIINVCVNCPVWMRKWLNSLTNQFIRSLCVVWNRL